MPATAFKDHYTLDLADVWDFQPTQSPAIMDYVARFKGLNRKPFSEAFTFCQLGCGNGLTSNTLAAACPQGAFYAIDPNRDYIKNAKHLAKQTKIRNVDFIHSSLESLTKKNLPRFDYIALHDVYPWLNIKEREQILRIINHFIKPDGLISISYDALPGCNELLPLNKMITSLGVSEEESGINHINRGLKYLKFLRDHQAQYFKLNPRVSQYVDEVLKKDLRYIAHKFFNESWKPLYFSEVANDMNRLGFKYMGTPNLSKNFLNCVPKDFWDFLKTANEITRFETHKSFILNEQFRYDIFSKEPASGNIEKRLHLMSECYVGSNCLEQEIKNEISFENDRILYNDPIYVNLIPALASGTRTIDEVRQLKSMQSFSESEFLTAIHRLIVGNQFSCFSTNAKPISNPLPNTIRINSYYNYALLKERLFKDAKVHLASSVTGNGFYLNFISGLLLLASHETKAEETIEHALALLKASNQTWRHKGEPIVNPRDQKEILEKEFTAFRNKKIPILLKLNVISA